MFGLAFAGLTNFSTFPLQICAYIGALIIFLGMIVGTYMSLSVLFYGISYGLSVWFLELFVFVMGAQFFCIWLLGQYVARMHEQQKSRPLYIISEKINNSQLSELINPKKMGEKDLENVHD